MHPLTIVEKLQDNEEFLHNIVWDRICSNPNYYRNRSYHVSNYNYLQARMPIGLVNPSLEIRPLQENAKIATGN